MPPNYNPLNVQIPGGLIGDSFSQEPVSFTDQEKIQAALRAQELNNQAVELSVANNQRQQEGDVALQNLLKQYAIANKGKQITPDQMLQVAQSFAIETGNMPQALAIEKATKERQGYSQKYEPYSETKRAILSRELGYDLPPDATPELVDTLTNLRGKNLYGQQVDFNKKKWETGIQSYAPGDWESEIDPTTGQGPNKEDGKKFTATIAAYGKIDNLLNQLTASLAAGGGNDPSDPEFVRQRQLIAGLQVAFKEKNNFGAALTANEQAINDAQLPKILARSDVGVGRAMIEAGLGRDPLDAVRNLRQILDGEIAAQAKVYKFRRKSNAWNQQQSQQNPSQETQQSQQQQPIDEETAYKENYKAKLRAQRGY